MSRKLGQDQFRIDLSQSAHLLDLLYIFVLSRLLYFHLFDIDVECVIFECVLIQLGVIMKNRIGHKAWNVLKNKVCF